MSRSNAKAAGEFTCQWRGSASCHCWTSPGSQLHLPKARRWGNTLDYHTTVAPAIYCKVSSAFLKASHHSSRYSPSPNINHPASGFCNVSSWGTEGSSAWLIFNSTTVVLFFADPPHQQWQNLCCQLWFSGGLYSTRQGALAGQHSVKWAPKQGCVYRHKAGGAESQGRAGKHCTNSCSTMPQGHMQSHIHSGLFCLQMVHGYQDAAVLFAQDTLWLLRVLSWEPTLERHGKTTS